MTKVSKLTQENKYSYGIKVENDGNRRIWADFVIPVVDVRDGENARQRIGQMVKSASRSKFLAPTYSAGGNSYQVSQKKD